MVRLNTGLKVSASFRFAQMEMKRIYEQNRRNGTLSRRLLDMAGSENYIPAA